MSKPDLDKKKDRSRRKAVALQYGADDRAPVVVASGMGYLAEKIVSVAHEHGVPIYEDDSLSTMLTQLNLGQETLRLTPSGRDWISRSKAPRDSTSILMRIRMVFPPPFPLCPCFLSASGSTHISENMRLPFQFRGSMRCCKGI